MKVSKLKGLRAERGLTQGDIADKLLISKATYNRKENTGSFSMGEVNIILDMFGCTYEELFKPAGGTTDVK